MTSGLWENGFGPSNPALHPRSEKSVRMGKEKMGAMDCKWQTAEAGMTASLKYAAEDVAALAALRWKWQGQELARNGRLVWTEREMTWTSTHNLICSQSKNVVFIRNSRCRYCSVFAVLWAFGSRLMSSFHRKVIVPLQTVAASSTACLDSWKNAVKCS